MLSAFLTNEVDASLSWTEFETGDGAGSVYYAITIKNDIKPDDEKPQTGFTNIKIVWENDYYRDEAVSYFGVNVVAQ